MLVLILLLPLVVAAPSKVDSSKSPYACENVDALCGQIQVGTPPVTLPIIFGSSSRFVWLLDYKYPNKSGNPPYQPYKSSTSVPDDGLYGPDYSTWNTMGLDYNDTLVVESKKVTQQFTSVYTMWGLETVDPPSPVSGVVGLGWDPALIHSSQPDYYPYFIFNLVDKNTGKYTVFRDFGPKFKAVKSKRDFDANPQQDLITWGDFDSKNCENDLILFDVPQELLSAHFWLTFYIESVGYSKWLSREKYVGAIDTELSLVFVSWQIFVGLQTKIPFQYDLDTNINTIDCDQVDKLLPVTFNIGGNVLSLDPYYYIIDVGFNNGKCLFGIAHDMYLYIDVAFGSPMLRQYCSVYDLGQNKVGFATAIRERK